MRGSFRLEPVATWINQPILVRLVSSDLREFIRSWSCFTPGVWSFARSEVVLRKNGWNRASGQTYAIRLLEWGLFIKGRGCLKRHLLYSKFCVRIDSGDGSGQFIRRKFSTQRVVFKLREGLGLPANKRCLFKTALFSKKILIPKRYQQKQKEISILQLAKQKSHKHPRLKKQMLSP